MKFADLHLHTYYSDGTYSPQELIEAAKKAGLSCIAAVDHDTVSGIPPLLTAAKSSGLEVIPGIELTAEYEGTEIHFLGYLIDYLNAEFIGQLESLRQFRVQRIYKICEKLQGLGINLPADSVFKIAGKGTVGRLHVARAMVKEGFVENTYEAFNKYINDRGAAYVCGFRLGPQEAINLIKQAKGIPVLAHPNTLKNDALIPEFAKMGLMGLEVYYSEYSQGTINFYLAMAKQLDLLVSGGSDCHGDAKPEVKIGMIKIPYELVEKIKEAKNKL